MPQLQNAELGETMSDRIAELIERHRGPFLEPVDGIAVQCPIHGNLGRSSPGGELYCPTCHSWFPAMPDVPLTGRRLEQKQAMLQARLAKRQAVRKRRERAEGSSILDIGALQERVKARQAARERADKPDDG
jgi:hypothetical protein